MSSGSTSEASVYGTETDSIMTASVEEEVSFV